MSDELANHLAREAYESRNQRLGKCRACGEPVVWWNTEHGRRVPLDPIPVLNIADHLPEGVGFGNLFMPKGTARVVALDGRADGSGMNVYRVHNDGKCIERLAETAE